MNELNPKDADRMNESALLELPGGWVWTRLGEIIEKVPLTDRKLKQSEYQEKGKIPVIDQGQTFIGGYTDKEEFKVSLKTPVIIFGDHTKIVKYVDFDFVAGADGVKVIRPQQVFYPKLFYYFIQTIQLPDKGYARHFQFLEKSYIPLPPLPEQRRIVAKVEDLITRLESGVSELKKTQMQLKRYRQSVLKAACEGTLVPNEAELAKAEGRDYEPADVLLEHIFKERHEKWNGKGKYKEPDGLPLPEGWSWANVGQMTDSMKNGIYKPSEFYTEDGFACLRMYNIDGGKIVWKDIKRMNLSKEEIGEFLLLPGDLLVNRVNSRELVGKAAVIPFGIEKCVFESKNIRVRVIDKIINPHYLCYRFTSVGSEYFNRNAQQVVGMASISQPQIARFSVPLPPLAEQRRIVAEVERRLSIADMVEKTVGQSLTQAERLRQSILKKAFEGRLVAQDASDEPAGVLLERIKAEKMRTGNGTKKSKQIKLSIKDVA